MNNWRTPFQPHENLQSYARTINVPDANLFIYDSVNGSETIILLHGLGDDADTWAYIFPALANADYRVIALDWPGSGRSLTPRRVTIYRLYSCIIPLLNQLGINQVHLVGHSMGAMIAHQFAAEYPEQTQSLTLLGGMLGTEQGKPSASLLLSMIPIFGEWRYTRLRRNPDAAYRSLRPYYANLDHLAEEDCDFLYTRVNQRVWSNSHRNAYFSLLRSLAGWLGKANEVVASKPVSQISVVFGADDVIVSPKAAEQAVSKLTGSLLTTVQRAGHNVQQEQPGIVGDLILENVSSHQD